MNFAALQKRIKSLYEGASPRSIYFRYALLTFDIVTVLFIVATSFLPSGQIIEALNILFGAVILTDFSARFLASRHPLRDFMRVSTWTDIIAIVSFLAPLAGESGAFLRILRTLRLLRNYQLLARLRRDSLFFRRNEEAIFAVTNLAVFIFVMTAIVYATQKHRNDQIDRQLCRRAVLHCYRPYDDGLWRHYSARHGWPPNLGRHNDLRRYLVLQSRPSPFDSEQGSLPLPNLRPAAP
jgi:voltage-gated potassium channel